MLDSHANFHHDIRNNLGAVVVYNSNFCTFFYKTGNTIDLEGFGEGVDELLQPWRRRGSRARKRNIKGRNSTRG